MLVIQGNASQSVRVPRPTDCQSPIKSDFGLGRCRKCSGCRLCRQNEWVSRSSLEMAASRRTWWCTLSYRDGATHKAASYWDVQLMLKHVRTVLAKQYGADAPQVRYVVVQEYGELRGRVHWHMALACFGSNAHRVTKNLLRRAWPLGNVSLKLTAPRDIARNAKYLTKYLTKADPVSGAATRLRASQGWGSRLCKKVILSARDVPRRLKLAEKFMDRPRPFVWNGVPIPKPLLRRWLTASRQAVIRDFQAAWPSPDCVDDGDKPVYQAFLDAFAARIARPPRPISERPEASPAYGRWGYSHQVGSAQYRADQWASYEATLRGPLYGCPDGLRQKIADHLAADPGGIPESAMGAVDPYFADRSRLIARAEAAYTTAKAAAQGERRALASPAAVQSARRVARADLMAARRRRRSADEAKNALARRIRAVSEQRKMENERSWKRTG